MPYAGVSRRKPTTRSPTPTRRGGKGYQGQVVINNKPDLSQFTQDVVNRVNQFSQGVVNTVNPYLVINRYQTRRSGKGYQGQTILNQSTPAQQTTPTKPATKTRNQNPPYGKYSETWWRKNIGNEPIQTDVEAAGTTTGVGPAYPSGAGGGYYDYGGYGGGSFTPYSNPFSEYRQGYALSSPAPQTAAPMRAVQAPTAYRGYATANQGIRWLQLLTNWKIG